MKYTLPFLKNSNRKSIGLDIGSYNLKVVEIEKKNDSCIINSLGIKDIHEKKSISETIKELFSETRISGKEVKISLSGENIVARHLYLPKMNDSELKKAMGFHLEDHIPFKSQEVYTDFRIIEDEATLPGNKIHVFLVAVKKDLLDYYLELTRKAGLEPKIVTMDALALMNALYFNYTGKSKSNICILNIGERISNLLIVKEKIPYFVRDTKFGGETITGLLQTKLSLDKKAAENLKHNLQNTSSPEITQIIKTALATLLNEMFVSLDFFENLTEQKIEELYICGGSSQLWGMKEFLEGYLNVSIVTLDPFKNFSISANISQETLKQLSAYFSIPIGLALEEN